MKNTLMFLVLIITTKLILAQTQSVPVGGYFYDGKPLLQKDSVEINNLIGNFSLDVSKYELIPLDTAASFGLIDSSNYTIYSVNIDKNTNNFIYKTMEVQGKIPKKNKYFTVFSLDSFGSEKIICLYVF